MAEERTNCATIRRRSRRNGRSGGPPTPHSTRPSRPQQQTQVLRAGDAAVSQRPAAHGPRAQLRHRRRAGAADVDARLQRAAPHGLGRLRSAGRERRAQKQHAAARVDAREHRRHEAADAAPGPGLRLGHRSRPPACPSTTAGTSGSFCACTRRAWSTAKRAR